MRMLSRRRASAGAAVRGAAPVATARAAAGMQTPPADDGTLDPDAAPVLAPAPAAATPGPAPPELASASSCQAISVSSYGQSTNNQSCQARHPYPTSALQAIAAWRRMLGQDCAMPHTLCGQAG